MNEPLVPLAWMATGIIVTTIISGAAVAIVGRLKAPEAFTADLRQLIAAGSIIRLATILSIVAVLAALCALDKIKGDATVAALSAIAGYVLGGERAARAERNAQRRSQNAADAPISN
jgi:cobalamin biosynthesis protein CbiG